MILPDKRYNFKARDKRKRPGALRIIIILLILAAIVATILVIQNFEDMFPENLTDDEKLYELWNGHNYNELAVFCEELLEEKPLDLNPLIFNGFAYFYQAVSNINPEEQIPLFNKTIINLRKAEIVKKGVLDGKVLYVLGKAYYHKGRYYTDQSIINLEGALELGFYAPDIHTYLGLCYSEIGDNETSIDYFLIAIENDPSDILFLTLAQTYIKLNEILEAEEYLLRTLNRTEDFIIKQKSLFLLGKIYREKDEYIKAEDQYRKIIELNPVSADAHYYLGDIYESLGDNIKARAQWRKATEIDPSHYGARLKLY